jgi:hypothetical protein
VSGWPGLDPRELAALDQFAATLRDNAARLAASLRQASAQFAAAAQSIEALGNELRVGALQTAIEDAESMANHPDLAQIDGHLDAYWSQP